MNHITQRKEAQSSIEADSKFIVLLFFEGMCVPTFKSLLLKNSR